MARGVRIALFTIGGFALVCGGSVWWLNSASGVNTDYYAMGEKLGMPLEPEALRPEPAAAEKNAAPLMRELVQDLEKLDMDAPEAFRNARRDEGSRKKAAEAIRRAGPLLKKAEGLTKYPHCQFDRDWAQGVHLQMPELPAFRDLANLFGARAVLAAERGDIEAALADAKRSFHLAKLAGDEPAMVSLLVRIACEAASLTTIIEIAALAKTEGQLKQARAVLDGGLDDVVIFDYIRSEVTNAAATARNVEDLAEVRRIAESMTATGNPPAPPSTVTRSGRPESAVMRTQLNLYLRHWMPLFEMGEAARDNNRLAEALLEMDKRTEELGSGGPGLSRFLNRHSFFAAVFTPEFGNMVNAYHRRTATHHMVQAYLDALAYRLKHGHPPKSLQSLPGPYPDPYSGESLKYKLNEKGFVIYSIGFNRTDDAGQENRSDSRQGDYIITFPPAPPRE